MGARPLLIADEARRAIYLDFEGRKDEPPVLLGTLWVSRQGQEPMLRQYVLDPAFASAAVATGAAQASLAGEIRSLVSRAQRQHRVLVGWSEHEVRIVRACAPELADAFDAYYRDARALARRWRKKVHPEYAVQRDDRGRTHTLAAYLPLTGYAVPPAFEGGRVGKSIGSLRASMQIKGSFDAVSTKLQTRWVGVLGHNEHDCRATRAVCLAALDELAPTELHGRRERRKHGKKATRRKVA